MSNSHMWKWAEVEDSKKPFRWVFDNPRLSPDKNDEGDLPKVT